jgi:hypothetical protein|tara:strand:- start:507 stop:737 length:231 start_codon:yes stop_codon:yes gene_type:complete
MTKLTEQMASEYTESIADDVNETIRLEYRLGGSFTVQEVETLVNQALVEFDSSVISFSKVLELVDFNLIEDNCLGV